MNVQLTFLSIYKTVCIFKLLRTLHTGRDMFPHSNAHSNDSLQLKSASVQHAFNSVNFNYTLPANFKDVYNEDSSSWSWTLFKLLRALHTCRDIFPHSSAHSNGCSQSKSASVLHRWFSSVYFNPAHFTGKLERCLFYENSSSWSWTLCSLPSYTPLTLG